MRLSKKLKSNRGQYDAPWANMIFESSSKANSIRFCGYVYYGVRSTFE
jgi:hypothetical protein